MKILRNNEDIENSTKCCISDNKDVDGDVKLRNHCHITGKYRDSAHRGCSTKVKLNHKIAIVLYSLKLLIHVFFMQEVSQFHFKINVIPNGLEKYMSFNINV